MCIVNKLSKTEVEEYKRDLPEEFVGYRCVRKFWFKPSVTGPLFQDDMHKNEPNTTEIGIHEAGDYSFKRTLIDYTPGFHVFKTEEGVKMYLEALHYPNVVVTPVTVRKEWVQEIGNAKVTTRERSKIIENHDVFVCDHIEVKEV